MPPLGVRIHYSARSVIAGSTTLAFRAGTYRKSVLGMHRTVRATLRSAFYVSRRQNGGSEGPELCSDEEKSVPAQQRGLEISRGVTQIRQNRCALRKVVFRSAELC